MNSIATRAPELPAVANSSIPPMSSDTAGATPLQSAFAELLTEISSPQIVSTADLRDSSTASVLPAQNTADENAVMRIATQPLLQQIEIRLPQDQTQVL